MPTIDRTIGAFFDASNARNRRVGKYTGPASYATGGDSFAGADVSMGRIEHPDFGVAHNGSGTFRLLAYDSTNSKVIWVVPNTGAEVANGTDLSTFTARFEMIGI